MPSYSSSNTMANGLPSSKRPRNVYPGVSQALNGDKNEDITSIIPLLKNIRNAQLRNLAELEIKKIVFHYLAKDATNQIEYNQNNQ